MATAPAPKRGEIWLVDFDPAVGAEIRKARPAVVLSVDAIGRLPLRIVVPITDWKPVYSAYPWFVELPTTQQNRLHKHSGADAFRFVQLLGEVSPQQIDEIAEAVAMCIGVP
jgi:mRNA interferase MazF